MRPDKKKVRHHDSRKREEKAKAKITSLAKDSSNTAPVASSATSTFSSVTVNPLPDDPSIDQDHKYVRRNISSNWTKYEIPSSDEAGSSEDEALTGQDFHLALESAGGADSLFQLRSEREWDDDRDPMSSFSNQYFALDLHDLEAAISCIPLHEKIDLSPSILDQETLLVERLTEKAEMYSKMYSGSHYADDTANINKKIISKLKPCQESTTKETSLIRERPQESLISPTPNTGPLSEQGQSNYRHSEVVNSATTKSQTPPATKCSSSAATELEDWLDDFLDE